VKGNEIDAAEAERLGMINQVVPDSLLEEEVQTWISLLLKTDPIALRNCKEFLVDTEQVAPSEASTYGIHLLATLLSSRRGIRVQKRRIQNIELGSSIYWIP
jgi:enoyl-CoA hydratase/carnithine racemase